MKIRYNGKKALPYTLALPIPFVSASDKIGDVTFNPVADVPDEYCDFLLNECGGAFVKVRPKLADEPDEEPPDAQSVESKEPSPYQLVWIQRAAKKLFRGKVGKWDAKRYVDKHYIASFVEITHTRYGYRLVPRSADYLARAVSETAVPAEQAESHVEEGSYESRGDQSSPNDDATDLDDDGGECAPDEYGDDTLPDTAEVGEAQDRQPA